MNYITPWSSDSFQNYKQVTYSGPPPNKLNPVNESLNPHTSYSQSYFNTNQSRGVSGFEQYFINTHDTGQSSSGHLEANTLSPFMLNKTQEEPFQAS